MFGQRLKELRKIKGIYQSTLAAELAVSQQTVSQYESGDREPDIDKLKEIADYFNVSVDFLIGRIDTVDIDDNLKFIVIHWNYIEPKLIDICINYIKRNYEPYSSFIKGFCKNSSSDFSIADFLEFMNISSDVTKQLLAYCISDFYLDADKDEFVDKPKLPFLHHDEVNIIKGKIKFIQNYISSINSKISYQNSSYQSIEAMVSVPIIRNFDSIKDIHSCSIGTDYIKSQSIDGNRFFYLVMYDESMAQFNIPPGCHVLIDTMAAPKDGDFVFFESASGTFQVRMLVNNSEFIILQTGNVKFKPEVYSRNQLDCGICKIIGKVIEVKISL